MSINFKRTVGAKTASSFLAKAIVHNLRLNKKVLWLVAGGSAITVAVETSKLIKRSLKPAKFLSNLTITLTDERYGPIDHPDSNWYQLKKSGFNIPGAKLRPILSGRSRAVTSAKFNTILGKEFKEANFKIGLFGIGSDGHTAGILPKSKAVKSNKLVFAYNSLKFERITITPMAIEKLDQVVVYALGEEKRVALSSLNKNLSTSIAPAQALKKVTNLTIFTNIKI